MKQSFIFVLILLTTLSIVNAVPTQLRKRITTFTPCAKTPIDVTRIEPDPLIPGGKGKFFVTGSVPEVIPKGYVMAVAYFDVSTSTPKQLDFNPADICQPNGALACPYPANTPFDITLSGPIPAILPDTYGIVIAVGRVGGENLDIILGCASAIVNGPPAPAGKAPPAGPPPAAPPPAPAPAPPPAAPSTPPPPPPPPAGTAPPAPAPASAPPGSAPSPSPTEGSGGIQDSLSLSNIFIGGL